MNRPISTVEEWKYWGSHDPLYGVLSNPRKCKGGESPWKEDEFFREGAEHWKALWPPWQSYGVTTKACLEVGCGVGRMTRQLAGVFDQVYALDVSEGMITAAKASAISENVEYHLTDGVNIPLTEQSVTAVFSMHVLQHLKTTDLQVEYFRRIHATLKPGGTMLVHLPIYKFPFSASRLRDLYGIFRLKNTIKNGLKRTLLRLGMEVHLMEFTEMAMDDVFRTLSNLGFCRVEIRIVPTHNNTQIHPLIFAAKGE